MTLFMYEGSDNFFSEGIMRLDISPLTATLLSNIIPCFRFIHGTELRVGVIEYETDKLEMLPVLDYLMTNEQIRTFDLKLNVDDNGVPTGKKGVFLVSAQNAFVPVERDNSVNTYSRISTVPQGNE